MAMSASIPSTEEKGIIRPVGEGIITVAVGDHVEAGEPLADTKRTYQYGFGELSAAG